MKSDEPQNRHTASFRDPSGFVFSKDGIICRRINRSYKDNYDFLIGSGLYDRLAGDGLLVAHKEVENVDAESGEAYKIIEPDPIPFISYPYEWCFSQLKHAALLTLKIQRLSMDAGMTLKDCSAYNVQFRRGKPVLIDTLSFERYRDGKPWVGYSQFCRHFLAPLALMSKKDVRLGNLLRIFIDGIPLDFAGGLLPWSTFLSFSILSHVHMQARARKRAESGEKEISSYRLSKNGLLRIIENLESAIQGLCLETKKTEWSNYYEDIHYSGESFSFKKQAVSELLDGTGTGMVLDLGSNTGFFSRIAGGNGRFVLSVDSDPLAVEKNYLETNEKNETNILPLLLDLMNPSAGAGWNNDERESFFSRWKGGTVLALALLHHLAITNNLPFDKIADFLAGICDRLIIEFVPKEDNMVKRLLAPREDIFACYDEGNFIDAFGRLFVIRERRKIPGSGRELFLMSKKT